ncbi:AraC family transcriptional regulator [Kitasatospora sp. NE20-6]|uniref:AraC family transcriptional regulator n=1 Tax=Kitasatospora sp. NE20-6 TaxID=2859066 RepID=UPI0034DC4C85
MDATDGLAALLAGPRARGAFLLRTVFDPPFAVRIRDEAPLTVLTMARGTAWIVPDDGPPAAIGPGDAALVRGPEPYTVADHPHTPVQAVVHPGQHSTDPGGAPLCAELDLGGRSWGVRADGAAALLSGTYQLGGEISGRLLRALPPVAVLPADAWSSPLPALLDEELDRDSPGQEAVLDRLLDLLLITVLREWFARPDAAAPGWYRAYGDPVVGRVLRLLHGRPAEPWTVAALAAEAGVSRAALARRFTELVGEPPMAYLTGLRLELAADLLEAPEATLAGVARRVGYGSPFALSAAFKRVRGVSPQEHREHGAHG